TAERREVKARSCTVAPCQRDAGAAERPDQHADDRPGRVAVLAQDVADARAVPCTERAERIGGGLLARMRHDQPGVVVDPRAGIERADEVVDLLSRRPARFRAETEPLVEPADARDEGPAQEERERDRAVPEVFARQRRGVTRP